MNTWWSDSGSGSSARRRPDVAPVERIGAAAVLAAALLVLPALAFPSSAGAQRAQQLDSGTFRISPGDAAPVAERFAVRQEGDTYQSAARITSGTGEDPAAGRSLREFRLQVDAELRPTFFELTDRNGQELGIVGVRSGNRMQLRARTVEGERWQELMLAPGLVVLPEGLAHPYYFVLRVLDGDVEPPLPTVLPEAGERRPLSLVGRSRESVSIGGTEIQAERIELRVGEQLHRVWADDQGRILRVEIPDRSWRAVRTAPPGSG